MEHEAYLLTCYAALLGKTIGVRLGAPVENWSAARIAAQYPGMDGYPVDYGVFAADDDLNGPLFFVRACTDDPADVPFERAVANAMLNYIPDHNGFFWWGGSGVSTEQTAYENLRRGLLPPESGSAALNGRVLSEQIGGQIFSDCWGYISLGDPARAAELAGRAASATHDGEGVAGARFVAACIALAPGETDARTAMRKALAWIDPGGGYARTVRDIGTFYEREPDDWRACLTHIEENYGTQRFGGVCHILPNAARMALALCYGGNDFSRTLLLCCLCGFDTDCNCGNVGSIMGALCGLEGVDARWIRPVNDVLLLSSGVGYRNNFSVGRAARLFADIAFGRAGTGEPSPWRFDLPHETHGAVAQGGTVVQEAGMLRFVSGSAEGRLSFPSYYAPGEVYDARYEPALAPFAYPGETIGFDVSARDGVCCTAFAETDAPALIRSEPVFVRGQTTLRLTLPEGGATVLRFGLDIAGGVGAQTDVHGVSFDRHAALRYDFSRLPTDDYGPRFSGGRHTVVRGFTAFCGAWTLTDGALCGRGDDMALITTGDTSFSMRRMRVLLRAEADGGAYLVCAFRGGRRYWALGVRAGVLELFERYDDTETRLLYARVAYEPGSEADLSLCSDAQGLDITLDGARYYCRLPAGTRLPAGAFGLLVRGAGTFRCLVYEA